jgi:predicted esterase
MPVVLLLLASFLVSWTGCGSGGARTIPGSTVDYYPDCRSVVPFISPDANGPVLTLRGVRVVDHPLGARYVDAGATALDRKDGDITRKMTIRGLDTLDTGTVGDYLVRYDVVNSDGIRATPLTRIVRVHAGAFASRSVRELGTTHALLGYVEHLPVHYSDDPGRRFPAIIYNHGYGGERDLGTPLARHATWDLFELIGKGAWDDKRPFVVLAPQRCLGADDVALSRFRIFLDYAISTYNLDTSRIYMAGVSGGAAFTWEYMARYPTQLAAVVTLCGGRDGLDCYALRQTPVWAFHAMDDTVVPYVSSLNTVLEINECGPAERARLTLYPTGGHDPMPTLDLSGLGRGDPAYDIYDPDIYTWFLRHRRR